MLESEWITNYFFIFLLLINIFKVSICLCGNNLLFHLYSILHILNSTYFL